MNNEPYVLIVDDDQDARKIMGTIISSLGIAAKVACNGQEALDYIATQPPVLILLDLMMPGMSGFEVISRLREQDGPSAKIPIIVVSAKTLSEAERTFLTNNVTRIMVKGEFDQASMLDNIRVAIKQIESTTE